MASKKQNHHRISPRLLASMLVIAVLATSTQIGSALPPFTQGDLNSIYVSEHYRDGGYIQPVGCQVDIEGSTDPAANSEEVWEFFAERGYSPQAIAAIIGNMTHESGVLPTRAQGTGADVITRAADIADPTLSSKNGGFAWGLVQWDPPSKFISTQATLGNADVIENQLIFLHAQLEGEYEAIDAIGGALNNPDLTIQEATILFGEKYERPNADALRNSLPDRIRAANGAFERFADRYPSAERPDDAYENGIQDIEYIDSCSLLEGGEEEVVDVVRAEAATGGKKFALDIQDGNAADFVSWVLEQANEPLVGGVEDGEWRYSSVTAMQELYKTQDVYSYVEASGTQKPQPGDIAFYVDPETRTQYADIVISLSDDKMTVVGVHPQFGVSRAVKSTAAGVNGLDGFGRSRQVATIQGAAQ